MLEAFYTDYLILYTYTNFIVLIVQYMSCYSAVLLSISFLKNTINTA